MPAGAVAVIAIRLGAPAVPGSARLELKVEELARAAGGGTRFEATDVWTGAKGATVSADTPWRPLVASHNSTFVVFHPTACA